MADEQAVKERTPDTSEITAFIQRAREGDPSALTSLRKCLAEHPNLWDALGDMMAHVRLSLIHQMVDDKDVAMREAINHKLSSLRSELEGPTPTPLECLAVDSILTCWLQLAQADYRQTLQGSVTLTLGRYHAKQAETAQRRYLEPPNYGQRPHRR